MRTYGSLHAFRNSDESFTHGNIILSRGKGTAWKMIRLFAHLDQNGHIRVQVTGVVRYPEISFEAFPANQRRVFHWADIEDVLSGMHPTKACRDLSGNEQKEFIALSSVLGDFDAKERAMREKEISRAAPPKKRAQQPHVRLATHHGKRVS